jgi:Domain of unknown function (DUF6456)
MVKMTDEHTILKTLRRLAGRGRRRFPPDPNVAALLRAHDLIVDSDGGALQLTETGRAFLKRGLADREVFAAQHRSLEDVVVDDTTAGRHMVTVNADESPLAWLRRRKGPDGQPLIDAAEFAAGERLRSDYTRGQLMPRITSNWMAEVAQARRGGSGGTTDLTEAAIAARRRIEYALAAVGPEFAGVLVDFCCFLKGIETIERERNWPQRSAKLVLRLALSALARHYGLNATAHGRYRAAGLTHWGADDYRPIID